MTVMDPADAPPPAPHGYDSGSAAFHAFSYANQHGWGPLVSLGAIYVVYYLAVSALMIWGIWPLIELFMELGPDEEPELSVMLPILGRYGFVLLLAIAISLIVWSVVEAALLRWLFGRGLRIQLGPVELRLMLIGVFFAIALPIAVWAAPAALGIAADAMGAVAIGILCALAAVAAIPIWIMLAVRFAPAGALTVYDERLHLFSAWAVSRGRFWPVVGAFVIAVLVYVGASIVVGVLQQILFMIGGVSALMPMYPAMNGAEPPDPAVIMEALTSPVMIAMIVICGIIAAAVAFLFQAMLAGVNAYGVKRLHGVP